MHDPTTRYAYVYLISNKSHTLYCGIATNLRARFEEHKTGAYSNAFTARYLFDRLVWFEVVDDLAAAAMREKQIKSWSRARKVALIQKLNPNWNDLSSRLDPLRLFE